MTCPRCAVTGGRAHSFEQIGLLADGKTSIIYSCPSLGLDPEDSPDSVYYYTLHIASTQPNPWIWILDFRGSKVSDFIKSGLGPHLRTAIQSNNFTNLSGLFIVNPNWAFKAILAFIKPLLKKETFAKIHLCTLGPIDTLHRIEHLGIGRPELHLITRKITTGVSSPSLSLTLSS
jgi:hypothetical protein